MSAPILKVIIRNPTEGASKSFISRSCYSFNDLKDEIVERMPELANKPLDFYFQDSDGDRITISTNEDFKTFQYLKMDKLFVEQPELHLIQPMQKNTLVNKDVPKTQPLEAVTNCDGSKTVENESESNNASSTNTCIIPLQDIPNLIAIGMANANTPYGDNVDWLSDKMANIFVDLGNNAMDKATTSTASIAFMINKEQSTDSENDRPKAAKNVEPKSVGTSTVNNPIKAIQLPQKSGAVDVAITDFVANDDTEVRNMVVTSNNKFQQEDAMGKEKPSQSKDENTVLDKNGTASQNTDWTFINVDANQKPSLATNTGESAFKCAGQPSSNPQKNSHTFSSCSFDSYTFEFSYDPKTDKYIQLNGPNGTVKNNNGNYVQLKPVTSNCSYCPNQETPIQTQSQPSTTPFSYSYSYSYSLPPVSITLPKFSTSKPSNK